MSDPVDTDLLLIARDIGLRQAMHGVPPQRARVLLRAFLDAANAAENAATDFILGMSISVDVTPKDCTEERRYFGTVTAMQESPNDKHGVTLLVQDAEPNFSEPVRPAVDEPVAHLDIDGSHRSLRCDDDTALNALPDGAPLYARPQPTAPTDDDALWEQTLTERDHYHDMADRLAAYIAAITGVDIGEHSSANEPWRNAILAADDYIAAQPAQQVPKGWKLVPTKMPLEMEVAFCEAWFSKRRAFDDAEMDDAYTAMLAAAPSPEKGS